MRVPPCPTHVAADTYPYGLPTAGNILKIDYQRSNGLMVETKLLNYFLDLMGALSDIWLHYVFPLCAN